MGVLLSAENKKLEALVLLVDEAKKPLSRIDDPALKEAMKAPLANDFKGKMKESVVLYTNSSVVKRLILLGAGKSSNLSGHSLRTLAACATQIAKGLGLTKDVGMMVPQIKKLKTDEIVQALAEGNFLVQLNFNDYKTETKEEDKARRATLEIQFAVVEKKDLKNAEVGYARGKTIANDVNWARRLIMTPGGDLTPDLLVKEAQKMVAASPSKAQIKTEFWTTKELQKNKFGGVLGVGQGSSNPPRFIVLEYWGTKKSDKPICLVGKGVTFDSGGLSLKPPPSMETMKYDMAGSASVMAAFKIVTDLKLKVNLVVLVPTAENMPSGDAIRPGDILKMASGKTVEVLNTDAEGRLILADALFWASTKYQPRAIVDVATLTGACALAVGEAAAGVFTNSKKLLAGLMKASENVQENLWPLPNFDDFYVPLLKSDVADMKNIGTREAGASSASIFLRHFVHNNIPWAHLDIAGCGWYESPRDFNGTKGSSGVPIRLLANFVEEFSKASF